MPKSAFPYTGGKYYHADWIVNHLPKHRCYVEPFGGAAGVLLNKDPSYTEIYNDINDDIVQFFRVATSRPEELANWLESRLYSRSLHEQWKDDYFDGNHPTDDIERAGRFFYLRFSQFGGLINGPSGFTTSDGTGGTNSARRFRNGIERIESIAERFEQVTIECLDWCEVVELYDGSNTVFYFDPPYVGTEFRYGIEFDHSEFIETILSLEAKWLVSYEDIPDKIPNDRVWFAHDDALRSAGNGPNGRKETTENLIMNFNPDETPSFSEANQAALTSYGGR